MMYTFFYSVMSKSYKSGYLGYKQKTCENTRGWFSQVLEFWTYLHWSSNTMDYKFHMYKPMMKGQADKM